MNKSSPFGQLKPGIAIDLIQCKDGQEIVVKKTKQTPACVNSDNVEKLREKGWTITQQMQEEMFEKIASNRMQGLVIKDYARFWCNNYYHTWRN